MNDRKIGDKTGSRSGPVTTTMSTLQWADCMERRGQAVQDGGQAGFSSFVITDEVLRLVGQLAQYGFDKLAAVHGDGSYVNPSHGDLNRYAYSRDV